MLEQSKVLCLDLLIKFDAFKSGIKIQTKLDVVDADLLSPRDLGILNGIEATEQGGATTVLAVYLNPICSKLSS